MSFEYAPGPEHGSDNGEYGAIAGVLRSRLEDAIVRQASIGDSGRMFTIVEPGEVGPEPLARFRLMDRVRAELDLRSSPTNWTIDIALPIESPDIAMPMVSRSHDYFVVYTPEEEVDRALIVRAERAEEDLGAVHRVLPDFMSLVRDSTVIVMKQNNP